MTRLSMVVALGLAWSWVPARVHGQAIAVDASAPNGVNHAVTSPGLYGTSWGVASFGSIRTYSNFSSPFGAGYGYGHQASYGLLPGRFGVGLWRPGTAASGGAYGTAYGYNTFPYPYKPGGPMYGPPIGVYAPGFGPGRTMARYAQ